MKTYTPNDILSITRQLGLASAYECKSCDYKRDAQRNLEGRTHYVDDDTLRFFNSRILSARHFADGLLYAIVESSRMHDANDARKNKRFTVFDVFGTVVNNSERDVYYRTTEQAQKARDAFITSFDAISHTVAELERRAARMESDAKQIRDFLA